MKSQYPPLIGGISQVPDQRKNVTQLRTCNNWQPDPVRGLCKRPGTLLQGFLGVTQPGVFLNARTGDSEHHLMRVSPDGSVSAWDAQSGELLTVVNNATAYLAGASISDLELVTQGSLSFILNRRQTVTMDATEPAPGTLDWGWFVIESLLYDTTYTITVDGTDYSYTTPASGVLDNGAALQDLASNIPGATVKGQTVLFTGVTEFSVGQFMRGTVGALESIAELPPDGEDGFVQEIRPAVGESFYLKWEDDKYVECTKPGEPYKLDASTMPHRIYRVGNTLVLEPIGPTSAVSSITLPSAALTIESSEVFGRYFLGQVVHAGDLVFRVEDVDSNGAPSVTTVLRSGGGYVVGDIAETIEGDVFRVTSIGSVTYEAPAIASDVWTPRNAGDNGSNPLPSFVGRRITGIGYFANRLVLLSGDSAVASKAGDPLNFFATSGASVIDDDPVDLDSGSSTPFEFRHAIEYRGQLILIGPEVQYALVGQDGLFSPTTAQMIVSSRLRTSTVVPPAQLDASWMVIQPNPNGTRVMEYYPNSDRDPNLGAPQDLTLNVPTLIPRGVFDLAADPDLETLALVSGADPTKLYIFKWTDVGRERAFASWYTMELPDRIMTVYFANQQGYVVVDDDGSSRLIKMDPGVFNPTGRLEFEGERFNPRLDYMRFLPRVEYDISLDRTAVAVYGAEVAMRLSTGEVRTRLENGRVHFTGNVPASDLVVGLPYMAEAEVPDLYPRIENSRQSMNGVKLHRLEITTSGSTGFLVHVDVPGRAPFTYRSTQATPINYPLDGFNMKRNYRHRIGVMADAEMVELILWGPSPLHTALQEFSWEGNVNMRQR